MQWWVPGHCTFFAPHTEGTERHSHPTLCPQPPPLSSPGTDYVPQSCSSEPSKQSAVPSQRQLLETHRPSSHCQTWGSPPQATSAGTPHSHWDLPLQHNHNGPLHLGKCWQCPRDWPPAASSKALCQVGSYLAHCGIQDMSPCPRHPPGALGHTHPCSMPHRSH